MQCSRITQFTRGQVAKDGLQLNDTAAIKRIFCRIDDTAPTLGLTTVSVFRLLSAYSSIYDDFSLATVESSVSFVGSVTHHLGTICASYSAHVRLHPCPHPLNVCLVERPHVSQYRDMLLTLLHCELRSLGRRSLHAVSICFLPQTQ